MRRNIFSLSFIIFSLLFLIACNDSINKKQFDPKKVAFEAEYNPLFDGQIYPSLILGLNRTHFKPEFSIFSCAVKAPKDNSVLRVVIDSSSLNYVTILQEIMPKKGEVYTFQPSVKWKYDVLRHLRQPGNVDLTFTCFINDEEVDVKNLHLAYRTVNECPLSMQYKGLLSDFRWLFASYVNEDHPYIETILTDIIDQGIVTRLSGYQNGEKDVKNQVFAVWYYALNRGIAYSSITCTSNPSTRANVQHIRFFDEVYNTRQANCVDACVFFASILRKIGLRPIIFVEPCHAYLGYYTDKSRKKIALLETTITSWVDFPDMEKSLDADGHIPQERFDKIKKYLTEAEIARYDEGKLSFDELKKCVAKSLFDKATEYDQETYNANREHFADVNSITYQQLDIEQLRKLVQPI